MRWLLLLAAWSAAAQDARFELAFSWWRTRISGQVQAAGLPVDLRSDLALADQNTLFGRASVRLGRHRIFLEGSPYRFSGENLLSRTIVYNGRQYALNTTVSSQADLDHVGAGYQFDVLRGSRGHFGLNASGAWLSATGTLTSRDFGFSGTHSQTIGIPLAGGNLRVWALRRVLSVDGDIKGMTLGDYGHYWRAEAAGALHAGPVAVRAGYAILDADVHERRSDPTRAGIRPRIRGPFVGLQLMLR